MTSRRPCPPAPGPLEPFAAAFDGLFASLAQRRAFREYLQGLLLPRDRNKTLTALAGAEPIVGAQGAAVQRLQWFLSESPWAAEAVNARRLEGALADPATAPHDGGVLVIDDTGDRKDGRHTAFVGRQYLGSRGKVEPGVVAVTSLWADEGVYYPLHVRPYTPAERLPRGQRDPAFRTKPQLAVALVDAALSAGVPFRAVVADCAYGDSEAFFGALGDAELPYVLALKPSRGTYAPFDRPHTPLEAARAVPWGGPAAPGGWTAVARAFRDGHRETWWATEVRLFPAGPEPTVRLVVATTDPAVLPPLTTWVLAAHLPRPGSRHAREAAVASADLAEVVRLYGLRAWVEQGYKQLKHELGWADYQVRAGRAIARHWALVCCAFSFCWRAWCSESPPPEPPGPGRATAGGAAGPPPPARQAGGRGEKESAVASGAGPLLAGGPPARPGLADAVEPPLALLARLVDRAPAPPPTAIQELLDAVAAGHALDLYVPT